MKLYNPFKFQIYTQYSVFYVMKRKWNLSSVFIDKYDTMCTYDLMYMLGHGLVHDVCITDYSEALSILSRANEVYKKAKCIKAESNKKSKFRKL